VNLIPANLGAEPKKVAALGALVVVLGVVYLLNRTPDAPAPLTVTSPGGSSSVKPAGPLATVATLTRNEPGLPLPAVRATVARGPAGFTDELPPGEVTVRGAGASGVRFRR
jgi:hypothetical protein